MLIIFVIPSWIDFTDFLSLPPPPLRPFLPMISDGRRCLFRVAMTQNKTQNPKKKTPESKKEEFRKYLERSGAIDSITSVLVGLYEEPDRPLESTDYIKKYLGGGGGGGGGGGESVVGGDVNNSGGTTTTTTAKAAGANLASQQHQQQENEKLKKENKDLRNQVKELNKTIETLKANLKHSREEAKKARQESSGES